MSHTRRIGLVCLMSLLGQFAKADFSSEISEASAPIAEGVPEVALVWLQTLLKNNLPAVEWRAVVENSAEAQIAAKEVVNTLTLLDDIHGGDLPWAKCWQARALARVHRWSESL